MEENLVQLEFSYIYAVTLTLLPKWYKRKCRYQYKKAVFAINNVLTAYRDHAVVKYMEPELTKAGNIHFHGVIQFTKDRYFADANNFIHNMFRNNEVIGHVYVTEIDDEKIWWDYCTKNLAQTYNILNMDTLFLTIRQNCEDNQCVPCTTELLSHEELDNVDN